ncbi:hypothetical protein FIBSPDRAFT_856802 [Athelia psychrophila]|uniref:Major facilitator superfamily (MFS) profile domain-containing protein n=1 Tax=Athelia psychrophila TaxID=1759441 RepID=A0A166N3D4_9AGAM|nr:hypothetical protein FIBSPDRAFT_856802 [Fibularhizoctonia sp. CBS 109695]
MMILAAATPPSQAETPVDGYFPFIEPPEGLSLKGTATVKISPARKYMLLTTFCLTQFLDSFNNSALYSAMPSFIIDLGITEGQSAWIMSAFTLTFASFLLVVSIAPLELVCFPHWRFNTEWQN